MVAPWFPLGERIRLRKNKHEQFPSVSVLIAAWNEEVGIRATLESVVRTHYPHLEIVVVNDGSTDRTEKIVQQYISEYRTKHAKSEITFQYSFVTNGGKARALNVGLKIATGDIIVTVDADSVMDHRAIRKLVRHYGDAEVASVAGNVSIGNRTRPLGIIQQLEYLYGFYFKRADSLLNAIYIVGGAAASYRRDVIIALGGFDETMVTEDIELSTRLQDHGYKVRYAPDAIVYTEGPSDFIGLFNQRLRWKYGRILTFFKYRHLFFSTKRPHNLYLTFVALPFALFSEIILFLEWWLLTIFFMYTFMTHDYIPLVIVIAALTIIVWLQILSDPQARYHKNLIVYAPGAWIIFYIIDIVEFQALMRSVWRLIRRQEFSWQRWDRAGVFDWK
jgi:poly-beta-1,6-N-acetyl-D-glucosamine synthase